MRIKVIRETDRNRIKGLMGNKDVSDALEGKEFDILSFATDDGERVHLILKERKEV